jgi:hypothetical protein
MPEPQRSPPERGWRVGRHVPRNIYRDGVPIAMIAGEPEEAERTAAFIVAACNEKEAR